MEVFGTKKVSTFINTVFDHFKFDARSPISLYLESRNIELNRMFAEPVLDEASKKIVLNHILSRDKQSLISEVKELRSAEGDNKLYHINNSTVDYLKEDCDEEPYYNNRSGLYIRSVIEEYCSLPFIKRARIYRKDVYETVEQACKEKEY